jgi:hypothetical protein
MDEGFDTFIMCMDENFKAWAKLEFKQTQKCNMVIYDLFNVYGGKIQFMIMKPMQIFEHEHFASKFH